MATEDLGSIRTEGAAAVPSPDSVDVLGPLLEAGQRAVKNVKDGIVDEATGEFKEAVGAAVAEPSVPRDVEVVELDTSLDPAADDLINRIKLYQTQRDQSAGSSRLNAQLKIRQASEELRLRFPRMADELAGEVRRFESQDPEFLALSGIDAQNEAFSKQAAAQLDAIKEKAYGSVDSDGLGMDSVVHKFGTKEFAMAYISRVALQGRTEQNKLYLNAVRSTDEVDARGLAQSWSMMQRGQASGVRAMVRTGETQRRAVAKAFQDPTAVGAAEAIALWGAPGGGRDKAIQDTNKAIVALEEAFIDHFPITMRNTEDFKAAESSKNAQVAALNVLLTGISSDAPTQMQAYEGYETFQAIEFERNNRMLVQQGREVARILPVLDLMVKSNFGARGKVIANTITGYLDLSLQGFLGRFAGIAQLDTLPAEATEAQLRSQAQALRAYNPDLYATGINTPEAWQTGAITDLKLAGDPQLLQAVKEAGPSGIAPDIASEQWIGRSSSLEYAASQGELNSQDARTALADFTVDGVVEQATASRLPGGQPNASTFALDTAERLFSTKVREANDRYFDAQLGTDLANGIKFEEVKLVDIEDLEDGTVRITVDEHLLEKLVRLASTNRPISGTFTQTTSADNEVRRARTKARKIATDVAERLNEMLRTSGTLEALQSRVDEIDWITAYNKVGAGRFTPGQLAE